MADTEPNHDLKASKKENKEHYKNLSFKSSVRKNNYKRLVTKALLTLPIDAIETCLLHDAESLVKISNSIDARKLSNADFSRNLETYIPASARYYKFQLTGSKRVEENNLFKERVLLNKERLSNFTKSVSEDC